MGEHFHALACSGMCPRAPGGEPPPWVLVGEAQPPLWHWCPPHSEGHNLPPCPRNLGAEGDVPEAGPSRRDVGCRSALREWPCLLSLALEGCAAEQGVLGRHPDGDANSSGQAVHRAIPPGSVLPRSLVKCPGCTRDQGWLWAHRLEEAGKGWLPGEQRQHRILPFQPLCAHDL